MRTGQYVVHCSENYLIPKHIDLQQLLSGPNEKCFNKQLITQLAHRVEKVSVSQRQKIKPPTRKNGVIWFGLEIREQDNESIAVEKK